MLKYKKNNTQIHNPTIVPNNKLFFLIKFKKTGAMREKLERDALSKEGAVVRLTKYEVEHRDGFVNRMTKETTSFFFTNYLVDTQVTELWKLFAKFGRVGEVYIPKKLDKQRHKFGFVKFKEVTDVEELSSRLGDIWIGTYHLRINLSRFGRNKKKRPSPPRNPSQHPRGGSEALIQPDRSFRIALVGGSSVTPAVPVAEESVDIPILDLEVEEAFLQTLIGSYVAWMKQGVEVKALQMKINMAGLQAVKVSAMGGRLVLISRRAKTAVGAPINNIDWWDSLLEDIKPWTPNLVCKSKRLWVRLYGVPSMHEGSIRSRLSLNGVRSIFLWTLRRRTGQGLM
jgi:hypothetical protein